jgi:putative transposase
MTIKVKGKWLWYYRAVDKSGEIVDFYLSDRRNGNAARRFLIKSINRNLKPSIVNIDQSGANTAGIRRYNQQRLKRIKIRQCKYLNNIVEQSHRFIRKMTRPMLGFKSFVSASITLAGIEVVRMLQKRQQIYAQKLAKTVPEMFRDLAA